jgi:drug/metabolite transporter (DMT)-like permease
MDLIAASSALDAIKSVPPQTWLKIALALGAVVALVIIGRKVAKANKFILGLVLVVGGSMFFFSWIYNRNEPAFMTPIIDKIAPFFPSAGSSYQQKQQQAPKGAP